MKTVSSILRTSLSAVLFSAVLLPASAQNDAGTPALTPNMNTPMPQVLKLPGSSLPGTLTTNKPQYRRGQPVRMTFRVQNSTGKAVTYNFGTGQRYDITISNAAGTDIWNWSHGKLFSQNLSVVHLAPSQSLVFTELWNGRDLSGRPVSPGTYTLSAHLTSNNRPGITGGVVVNTDPDPTNMGMPTRTPAEAGAIRQVDPAPQVSAKATVVIR